MDPLINLGVKATRKAGDLILRYIDRLDRVYVEKNAQHNLTSEIDKSVAELLVEEIQELFPQHSIVSEELGELDAQLASKDNDRYQWILDPINATHNFLHGHPHFATAVAIKKNDTIEHSVIYDPLRNEIFTASRGQGAYLNNRRIRVSGQNKFELSSIISGNLAQSIRLQRKQLVCINKVMTSAGANSISGSPALDLAYVACGRAEAFWQPQLQPWESAAGWLLVQESGGFVANFDGNQSLETGNIVAGNKSIFNDVLALVKTSFKTQETS